MLFLNKTNEKNLIEKRFTTINTEALSPELFSGCKLKLSYCDVILFE